MVNLGRVADVGHEPQWKARWKALVHRSKTSVRRTLAADPATAAVKIVILTTFEMDEYVFEALGSGAWGFLVKHCRPADLIHAVRVSAAG